MTDSNEGFDIITNRRNITVSNATIENFKAFSKQHKLKMYETVNALSKVLLEDEEIGKRVVEIVEEARNVNPKTTSGKLISQLPSDARKKLKSLTPDQLAALLENV